MTQGDWFSTIRPCWIFDPLVELNHSQKDKKSKNHLLHIMNHVFGRYLAIPVISSDDFRKKRRDLEICEII